MEIFHKHELLKFSIARITSKHYEYGERFSATQRPSLMLGNQYFAPGALLLVHDWGKLMYRSTR